MSLYLFWLQNTQNLYPAILTFFFSEWQDINTNAFFHPSSFSSCLSESLIFDYFYFHSFGSLTVAQICTAKAAVVETMRFGGKRNLKMKLRLYLWHAITRHARICGVNSTCYVWLCASVKETAGIFVIQRKHLLFLNRSFHVVIMRCILAVKRVFVMFYWGCGCHI